MPTELTGTQRAATEASETIFQMPGDVIAALVPELRTQLRDIVGGGATQLVLDFSSVRMVDSAGLGLLISTHNSLKKNSGRLSVVNASKQIFDLFRSMRVHQHFSVSEGR